MTGVSPVDPSRATSFHLVDDLGGIPCFSLHMPFSVWNFGAWSWQLTRQLIREVRREGKQESLFLATAQQVLCAGVWACWKLRVGVNQKRHPRQRDTHFRWNSVYGVPHLFTVDFLRGLQEGLDVIGRTCPAGLAFKTCTTTCRKGMLPPRPHWRRQLGRRSGISKGAPCQMRCGHRN